MEREPLTEGERSMLEQLRAYLEGHDFPPTIRELAEFAVVSSTETFRVTQKLRQKGYVTKGPTRTMRIIP